MRLDLNLVVVLEAIMIERNVTRAAAALHMTQPAASNALRRARSLVGDQLFLKVANGVQPTARMLAIWPGISRSLDAIRGAMAPQRFEPASDSTTFRLAVTDSLAGEAVRRIALEVRAAAPAARTAFAIHTNATSLDRIERGTLDCAVGMFPAVPRTMHVQGLRADRYVCAMRRGHRLARRMSLDDFVAAAHVLVTPSGNEVGVVDGWLSLAGRSRSIEVVVNHFADALAIVAESDLLACVPEGFAQRYARALVGERVSWRALPFETEKVLYKLVWHERLDSHPAHRWFRAMVAQACRALPARARKT